MFWANMCVHFHGTSECQAWHTTSRARCRDPIMGQEKILKRRKKMYIYTHIEVVSPFWPEAHPRVPFHVIYGKNGDFLSPFYCSGRIFVFEYYQYSLHILSLFLFLLLSKLCEFSTDQVIASSIFGKIT